MAICPILVDLEKAGTVEWDVPDKRWTLLTEDDLEDYKTVTYDPDDLLDDYYGGFMDNCGDVLLFEGSIPWIGVDLWKPVFLTEDPNNAD